MSLKDEHGRRLGRSNLLVVPQPRRIRAGKYHFDTDANGATNTGREQRARWRLNWLVMTVRGSC